MTPTEVISLTRSILWMATLHEISKTSSRVFVCGISSMPHTDGRQAGAGGCRIKGNWKLGACREEPRSFQDRFRSRSRPRGQFQDT